MSAELKPTLRQRSGGRRAVPSILQMEMTECGAACLAMILAYYGKWMSLEELRVRCGVSRDGSKAVNVLRAARELGLAARAFRRDPLRLFDLPFPMILFWNFNHFVVLEGIRGKRVYINDPATGPRKLSWEEFDESFTGVCLAFQPGAAFLKGGSPPSTIRGLLVRLGHAKKPLAFVALAALALIVPGLAVPTFVKVFVDQALIPLSESLLTPLLIGLGVAAVLQAGLTWLQQVCLARMESKLSTVTTLRFFAHLFTLPTTFFVQRFAGDIASRVASNDKVARLISGQLATSAVNSLAMAAYGAVMLSYDFVLALAAFGMVSLNLVALVWIARAREIGSRRLLKEQGRVAGASVNGLSMIETLKSDGSERRFFARWAGLHANAVAAQQELGDLTARLNAVPPLLSALLTVVVLGVGGLRVLEGALTIGGLVAFQMLSRSFAQPIEGLVQFSAEFQVIKGDIARLDDVLGHPSGPADPIAIDAAPKPATQPRQATFAIENLTFGYNTKEPPVVEDFSLRFRPGQRVALVGGSGSGKSTIGKLACRLLDPWSGTVRIDDRNIADMTQLELSSTIAYVDQNIVLFDGSVRDNVTLWNPTVEEQAVTQALRDAGILDEVMARPGKYDADVGENGRFFSGGQRQLLELARALVLDPDILILDEATAALDAVTEARIDSHLRQRGCTCLIVAHRLSTIRDADEIVVLDKGRVAERGTHQDLMERNGAYSALIRSA